MNEANRRRLPLLAVVMVILTQFDTSTRQEAVSRAENGQSARPDRNAPLITAKATVSVRA